MKNEIVAVCSIFLLLVINTAFWSWFAWMWSVTPDDAAIAGLAVMNIVMMIFATCYFGQKYSD